MNSLLHKTIIKKKTDSFSTSGPLHSLSIPESIGYITGMIKGIPFMSLLMMTNHILYHFPIENLHQLKEITMSHGYPMTTVWQELEGGERNSTHC